VKPESTSRNNQRERKTRVRACERNQAAKYLEILKDDPQVAELKEKYQKAQVLSKRELKILAALAERKQATIVQPLKF
jgi:hypothetical protein